MKETKSEFEEPPGPGRPPYPWGNVPPKQRYDRRWPLIHRLNTIRDFARVIGTSPEEVVDFSTPGFFRGNVPSCLASPIYADDPIALLGRQIVPTLREAAHAEVLPGVLVTLSKTEGNNEY